MTLIQALLVLLVLGQVVTACAVSLLVWKFTHTNFQVVVQEGLREELRSAAAGGTDVAKRILEEIEESQVRGKL